MADGPPFIVTIDAEADNAWIPSPKTTTRNARGLSRFQALCDHHGLPATYLTDPAMAADPHFVQLATSSLDRKTAEVGLHVHAWSTPPHAPDHKEHWQHLPFLTDYDEDIMEAKVGYACDQLLDALGVRPRSHRGGRWAWDERLARVVQRAGCVVDSSVTPHVSWAAAGGLPEGRGGPDYRHALQRPHRQFGMLEVPMTIRRRPRPPLDALPHRFGAIPLLGRPEWLRPRAVGQVGLLTSLLDQVSQEGGPAVFMLHSSELSPGCSPTFPDAGAIDALYADLDALFAYAKTGGFQGQTLSDFYDRRGAS